MKKRVFTACIIVAIVGLGIFFFSQYKGSGSTDTIYLDQNALELENDIPKELQDLPYVIYPTDVDYDTVRFNFNKRFNIFPHAIITPRTNQEAATALKLLKKYNVEFSIRSGGHCYEPGSLSSGYIFDLRNFNAISPDIKNSQVSLGAGCRLGDVIETLGKIDFAIPTGTCPSVCVGGLTLGGGSGVLVRPFGLTCDSVKSITLLNANAEIVEVDANNYPDLFWALLGAGNGSYGIVLGFTFQMHAIPSVSYCDFTWEWDPKTVSQIIQTWQAWIQKQPDSISSQLRINYSLEKTEVGISALKVGSEPFTEWESDFNPLKPTITKFTGRYIDSSQYWSGSPPFPFFKMKSKILMQPLSPDAIDATISYFETLRKDKAKQNVLFDFDAFGSKVSEKNTAFYPRKAFGWWYQSMYWDFEKETAQALSYSRNFYSEISKYVSKYCYANTVDYDLGKDYLDAYYGDNVDKLIEIKKKYDPNNVFHWEQSIPVSL